MDRERSTALNRERTHLARERTILAHIRTGVSSFIFGTVLIGFFGTHTALILGGAMILIGVFFFLSGWISFLRSNRRVQAFFEEVEEPLEKL